MSELIEELKRLHADIALGQNSYEFYAKVFKAFPAIVAKLEAAQRLRDAVIAQHCNGACVGNGKSIIVRNALAAFDKEQTE